MYKMSEMFIRQKKERYRCKHTVSMENILFCKDHQPISHKSLIHVFVNFIKNLISSSENQP